MLIPPSVLMIFWGILTDQSIGRLFLAGVLPGLLPVTMMIGDIVLVGVTHPGWARARCITTRGLTPRHSPPPKFRLFTPTEGAGAGAALAAINDSTVGVQQIFRSTIPYWIIMLIASILLVVFPEIVNVLPNAAM